TDNLDAMPRDGTDNGGTYALFTGLANGPGSPRDENAWFNVLPPVMGSPPMSAYADQTTPPRVKYPFPGNGVGKIWQCPSARASDGDVFGPGTPGEGGIFGFFTYVMNLDLKLNADICAHAVIGNSPVYPNM